MDQGDTGFSEASRYYGISTNREWKYSYFRTRTWTHQPYLPTWWHRLSFNQDIGPYYDK